MPLLNQLFAQLDVIEDLAIERDPQLLVCGRHRLDATREVDDAQPRVSEAGLPVDVNSRIVRSAMADCRDHPADEFRVGGLTPKSEATCYATHLNELFSELRELLAAIGA